MNLAELARRTGLSRFKLRTLKKNGFTVKAHGLVGRKAETTVLSGYTGVIDDLLRDGVKNSVVCYDRIREQGYRGSQTVVRDYVRKHQHLLPPKRQLIAPQGNRGRRYETGPGESFQMDWGFVEVVNGMGCSYKVACFAMICHHCVERYV